MVHFRVERASTLPATECWRRLTRWQRHADAVPLTVIVVRTPPPAGLGTVFVARTGIGPVRFDDPMEVVEWHPPAQAGVYDAMPDPYEESAEGAGVGTSWGRCRLAKRGRVVTGWAELTVRPGAGGSRVIWREELRVRLLPSVLDRLLAAPCRLVFGRVIDTLLRTGG